MNNVTDEVNKELYCRARSREVRIGFEDKASSLSFRFFITNLLQCYHLLIKFGSFVECCLGSAVRIANFSARFVTHCHANTEMTTATSVWRKNLLFSLQTPKQQNKRIKFD